MGKRILSFFIAEMVVLTALYFQILNLSGKDSLIGAGQEQNTYTLSAYSMRAGIYDRNFKKLVNREESFAAAVLPSEVDERFFEYFPTEKAADLSSLISLGKPFLYITDKDPSGASGVDVFRFYKRYSEKQILSNIIGYTDASLHGAAGLEKHFDSFFSEKGSSLKISYSVNAMGSLLEGTASEIFKEGSDNAGIVLTIDRDIQEIVEKAGENIERGTIVIMDPYNGEILASVSFPTLDINNLSASLSDENSPFLNRAFRSYSPGSVFKLAVAAAALETGMDIETFNCEGEISLAGTTFKCHKQEGHGEIDLKGAIEGSCNPYFINLGQKIGFSKIREVAEKLGFGTGIDLGGGFLIDGGFLPSEAEIKTVGDLANLSFGQGALSISPVQLASFISAIVNSGKRPTPQLIKGYTSDDGTRLDEALSFASFTPAFSADVSARIKELMISAVENGTGSPAMPKKGGAGGKTGSAETGQYLENGRLIINALFCGFYPAMKPKYSIVVLVENGGSGSLSAGPIFKEICDSLSDLES